MNTIGLFAYGEMGHSTLQALVNDYKIIWIILPSQSEQSDTEKQTELLAKKYKINRIYSPSSKNLSDLLLKKTPDAVIIASFNKILPENLLTKTKFINVHLGDLPRFRGRANVNWAIINNRKELGLTIHEVAADLDAGNIYKQQMIKITKKDTVKTVYDSINSFLLKNISHTLQKVLKGYQGTVQKGEPTYCCTRLPEDGLIDWNKTSDEIDRFIRALTKPYPGAFTFFEGKRMIIWDAEIPKKPKKYEGRIPGRIASIIPNYGVEILTGDSLIIIKTVSYQNKIYNASAVIKSVKKTLGINWVALYEKFYEDSIR